MAIRAQAAEPKQPEIVVGTLRQIAESARRTMPLIRYRLRSARGVAEFASLRAELRVAAEYLEHLPALIQHVRQHGALLPFEAEARTASRQWRKAWRRQRATTIAYGTHGNQMGPFQADGTQ